MKYLFYIPILLLLVACTLDSKQEERLNTGLSKYIKSYNEDLMLQYTALTHVKVVAHYKALGEKEFVNHFQQNKDSVHVYYGEFFMKDTKEQGKNIQRCYTVAKYTEYKEIDDKYEIYAISEDEGNTWFFVNEDDYFNKDIKIKTRLFKKK